MTARKACKDCGSTTRALSRPGPRCATCHRAEQMRARKAAHSRHIQRRYGITPEDYAALYEAQGGHCAICEVAVGKVRRLAVDHDHAHCTDGCRQCVRGLLCSPCNIMIGRLGTLGLERAACYLADPPARKVLGPLEDG